MKPITNLMPLAIGSVLLASCHVYPESKPEVRHKPNPEQVKTEEQAKADELKKKEEAEKKKAEEELKSKEEAGRKAGDLPGGESGIVKPPVDDSGKRGGKPTYPVAKKVPGQEGFVLSPYNNRKISIKDDDGNILPPGTLVSDPFYKPEEKKRFVVP